MTGMEPRFRRRTPIAEKFGVHVPPTLPERFNIAPSQLVLAVREQPGTHERELVALQWGLIPFWADDPEIGIRMINARSETAATRWLPWSTLFLNPHIP
jgi:putative SOS response-associated peptidase YedK